MTSHHTWWWWFFIFFSYTAWGNSCRKWRVLVRVLMLHWETWQLYATSRIKVSSSNPYPSCEVTSFHQNSNFKHTISASKHSPLFPPILHHLWAPEGMCSRCHTNSLILNVSAGITGCYPLTFHQKKKILPKSSWGLCSIKEKHVLWRLNGGSQSTTAPFLSLSATCLLAFAFTPKINPSLWYPTGESEVLYYPLSVAIPGLLLFLEFMVYSIFCLHSCHFLQGNSVVLKADQIF